MVFRGGPVVSLDGKGRVTVPARWRDMLVESCGGQLIVARKPDGCLGVYPLQVWEQIESTALAMPAEFDAWRRFYVGSATEVEIDSASRLLVPPELRDWAGLTDKVKFMGVGSYFELWDTARYEAHDQAERAKGMPEVLRNLVIR